jgi:Transglutaminase-like superfamily
MANTQVTSMMTVAVLPGLGSRAGNGSLTPAKATAATALARTTIRTRIRAPSCDGFGVRQIQRPQGHPLRSLVHSPTLGRRRLGSHAWQCFTDAVAEPAVGLWRIYATADVEPALGWPDVSAERGSRRCIAGDCRTTRLASTAMDERDYYRSHSPITEPGTQRHLLAGLPADPASLSTVIGGVMVHRDQTWRFGFTLPEQRRDEANTRSVEGILAYLGSLDERRPEQRFAGTCRDFAVLLCALLREANVPARARVGFAGYLTDANTFFDDHWVVEVWHHDRGWYLVDAQLASAPTGTYTDVDIDPLDVPRDAFLVGGQAWQECRAGTRDLDRIGTSAAGLTGLWEVQGNVVRDLASLNRVETLPWDNWGLIPVHYDRLEAADLDLLDNVAIVSAAGGPLSQATDAYRSDLRLPAPAGLIDTHGPRR